MADLIMSYSVLTIIVILGLFSYVFLISSLFPKLFLSPEYKSFKAGDVGVKKYIFKNGRAVVYLPASNVKRYVEQYILSDNGGERFVKCKLMPSTLSIRYVVAAFDASDKIIDVLEVTERGVNGDITRTVALPPKTAYISLSIREINGSVVSEGHVGTISPLKASAFVLLTSLVTLAMSLLLKEIFVKYADLFFDFTSAYGEVSGINSAFFALSFSAVYSFIVLKSHCNREVTVK